jgi:DNA-directed RNA polymerase specialized sigma24 family protein
LASTLTDEVTVDHLLMTARQEERFVTALASLPPLESRCFAARMANKKLREIAEAEGLDLRRVAEAVNRALQHIKRLMDGEGVGR